MLLQAWCIISKLSVNQNWRYSTKTPNLCQNRWFFVQCDHEILQMTLKNNRVSLLCYFKLCASCHNHCWIQTEVTVRKRPIRVRNDDFLTVWPWNLTDYLEKQLDASPKHHSAFCIISSSYVNWNCYKSPETAKLVLTSVTLTFDCWFWPLAWTSLLAMVKIHENFMMIRWQQHCEKVS